MRTEGTAPDGAAGWAPLPRPATSADTPVATSALRRDLLDDPLGDPVLSRDRIRPAVAAALTGPPGPDLLAAVDELMLTALSEGGVELSGREWLEVTGALDRCTSFTAAATLTAVAALDRARLAENPPAQRPATPGVWPLMTWPRR